uniref:RNA polymerase subunit H/Rpb5 C-terminal domain-containing protein n=1 Tax=viral metagenome TaxID=1070528 RepID=A0A6C0L3B2_9ZZZZ|tara:strand:- start:8032 stop:8793 length:762 start_codon:yes stop_codon:yes gene_type:complete
MDIVDKVNNSRYTLKSILSDEWDTSTIADLSREEIEKMYTVPSSSTSLIPLGNASGCNFSIRHKHIPSHRLHIIYFNFPEIGRQSSKVTKSACDKIESLYSSGMIDFEDSVFVIINDNVSESLEKSFTDLNIRLMNELEANQDIDSMEQIKKEMEENNFPLQIRHFRNVYIFGIDGLTNNMLQHRLVPKHKQIRDPDEIQKVLTRCNCSLQQLPIILKNDAISKLKRLTTGDVCEITRKSVKCGQYPFYRVCK